MHSYSVLQELPSQLNLFCNLFMVYNFALLLLTSQTTGERVFSMFKVVKTKLWLTLNKDNFLLLNI